MQTLLQCIKALKQPNHEGSDFITQEDISSLLTKSDVYGALQSSGFPEQTRDEAVKRVLGGGQRTFAILLNIRQLHLLTCFLDSDGFLKIRFDDRLPMEESQLQALFGKGPPEQKIKELRALGDLTEKQTKKVNKLEAEVANIKEWAQDFFGEQFLYCIPSFQQQSSHRSLHLRTRLPFLEENPLGKGSYGSVFEVKLPNVCIEFLDSKDEAKSVSIARKELESTGNSYKKEVRVLEILRLIKHPNILELYCSYTYRGRHNLLFPLAGCDLDSLLSRPREKLPETFLSDSAFLIALCGLCSGLKCVHHYSSQCSEFELSMIGCHHDLKPNNILIQGSRLVLADFGISNIKYTEEGSKTQSKGGGGYYAAPESRNHRTFEELRIGRASDIWALGCILFVVLTYLKKGSEGVQTFEQEREQPLSSQNNYFIRTFHVGGNSNPKVWSWFDSLRSLESCTPSEHSLLDLIRNMLNLDFSKRPGIIEVLSRLRFIASQHLCETISTEFSTLTQERQEEESVAFKIERLTFEKWYSELCSVDLTGSLESSTAQEKLGYLYDDSKFERFAHTIQSLKEEVRKMGQPGFDIAAYPSFVLVQRLVQQLLSDVSKDTQRTVRSQVEAKILEELPPDTDLEAQLDEASDSHARILELFKIKHMKQQTEGVSDASLIFKAENLQPPVDQSFLTFTVRKTRASDSKPERDVIVETLEYGEDIHDEEAAKQIFDRMLNILRLPTKTTKLRGLSCSGFYHDRKALSLVYEIPVPIKANGVVVTTTLAEVLSTTQSKNIILTNRFALALKLANAVLEIDTIRWLHKGISSHNVVFFTAAKDDAFNLESPYITGFSHRRPDEVNQYSNLLTGQEELREYLHPTYRNAESRERYTIEYDYYSLGLVLMEIGSWRPLRVLIRKPKAERKSTQEIKDYLEIKAGEILPATMGKTYTNAVVACLTGAFRSNKSGTEGKSEDVRSKFARLVVGALASCSV